MTEFADLLRTRRLMLGETQRQTAERLGVTQSSYSRWESGHTTPDPSKFEALAASLDVPTERVVGLIEGEDPEDAFAAVRAELDALRREVAELRARLEAEAPHPPER